LHFSKELELTDSKASNGWLDSWTNRFSIAHFNVCGDTEKNFQSRIDTIVQDYKPEDIFNCDETGLFLELFPIKEICMQGWQNSSFVVHRLKN
jgi:hypothetical protein